MLFQIAYPSCRLVDVPINLRRYVHVLPSMPNLTTLEINARDQPPPNELICAAAATPQLRTIILHETPLNGPFMQGFSLFSRLENLTINENVWEHKPGKEEERDNVSGYLRAVSRTLRRLDISAGLLDLERFYKIMWPQLSSLTLSGPCPAEYPFSLSSLVACMPSLQSLALNLCATELGSRPDQGPVPIYGLQDGASSSPLSVLLPKLTSLSLSNIRYPQDPIITQIPHFLSTLRVTAFQFLDPYYSSSRQSPGWQSYSPLSLQAAFDIIPRLAGMSQLTELSLSLQSLPTPGLVDAIASTCPQLQTLELEEGPFHDFDDPRLFPLPVSMINYRGWVSRTDSMQYFSLSLPFLSRALLSSELCGCP